ncbi:peptidase [Puniceibacterium antarcticum]|uniref:Peptidase n=1 Tax=Puniceibacterium antarcticum TaxID=1206336 RepID=A0A2G8RA44_9RHOB|nr:peptidase [Puniceibacterium antarcticum]PIL18436.1 peptidase [Puniceibacterium antarcticum]
MSISARVIIQARAWIGTPYVHQASCQGAGCDCLGLLRGIWRAIYGEEPEPIPPYSMDWSEPQGDEVLLRAGQRHLVAKPLLQAGLGDVLLFRMRDGSVAKHLGLQSQIGAHPAFIHAYCGHGVIESALSAPWQRRIAARFDFPQEAE